MICLADQGVTDSAALTWSASVCSLLRGAAQSPRQRQLFRARLQEAEWRRAAGEGGCIQAVVQALQDLVNDLALEVRHQRRQHSCCLCRQEPGDASCWLLATCCLKLFHTHLVTRAEHVLYTVLVASFQVGSGSSGLRDTWTTENATRAAVTSLSRVVALLDSRR